MSERPSPEAIASELVARYSWTTNVMRNGRLVGQQVTVAADIAQTIEDERQHVNEAERRVAELEATLANERETHVTALRAKGEMVSLGMKAQEYVALIEDAQRRVAELEARLAEADTVVEHMVDHSRPIPQDSWAAQAIARHRARKAKAQEGEGK